jgi:hypothetical protein
MTNYYNYYYWNYLMQIFFIKIVNFLIKIQIINFSYSNQWFIIFKYYKMFVDKMFCKFVTG